MQYIAKTMVAFLLMFTASAFSSEMVSTSPCVVLKNIGTKLFSRTSENQQEIKKFPALI
jgi:ABC-type transporter MlaC component